VIVSLHLLEIITSFLIGPFKPRMLAEIFVPAGVLLALGLKRSFQGRTLAILGVLGMMFLQSMQFAFAEIPLEFLRTHIPDHPELSIISDLFKVNLGLALVGALAAVCAGIYIEFGKSRMEMAEIFPGLNLLEAPPEIQDSAAILAESAGIVTPKVCLIDAGIPSAFTVRVKRKYVIGLSVGLLESLDQNEVQACIAHEISHLKNRDFMLRLFATIAKVALFARPLTYLLEPALYRAREYLADRTAAHLLGGPAALISALSKLDGARGSLVSSSYQTLCICSIGENSKIMRLFDKHPSLSSRIRALRELGSR
jgi:heat shock protein HtpX